MFSLKRTFADLNLFRREYLRNRVGLFFALIFPVILILIFGAIFSGGSSTIQVYAQNQDNSSPASVAFLHAMNITGVTQITLVPNDVNFSHYLLARANSIGIVIPSGFGNDYNPKDPRPVNVTVYSNPTDTSGEEVLRVASGVINELNLRLVNGSEVIGLQSLAITGGSNYKYIDFLIPGLIGFSVLTSPMFSMVNISSEYKKSKLFKQLSLTPLTKGEWLTSKVIWYMILSMISFLLMVTTGIYGFGAHITITAWIIPFLIIGPLFFVSLGMLVGTVTKSVESAGVVGNIITFPMMFLSGTFFPVSSMPAYLQAFAHVLPLYYLIDGLNEVMTYNNLSQAILDIGVLVVLSVVVFALAVRFFKWRED